MNASTMAATYTRKALDRTRRGTCPCCLKNHNARKGGEMTRHGWKETGRRNGEYGLGWQFGECWGTGMRPLEETDRDGLRIIARLDEEIAAGLKILASHEEGLDTYLWEHEINFPRRDFELPTFDAIAACLRGKGVEISDRERREEGRYGGGGLRKIRRLSKEIARGSEATVFGTKTDWDTEPRTVTATCEPLDPDRRYYGSDNITVPAYETLRKTQVALMTSHINRARDARKAVVDAVEHHRENPSWGTPHGKAKCVHLAKANTHRHWIACNYYKKPRDVAHSTGDRALVTCSRCMKAMEKRKA